MKFLIGLLAVWFVGGCAKFGADSRVVQDGGYYVSEVSLDKLGPSPRDNYRDWNEGIRREFKKNVVGFCFDGDKIRYATKTETAADEIATELSASQTRQVDSYMVSNLETLCDVDENMSSSRKVAISFKNSVPSADMYFHSNLSKKFPTFLHVSFDVVGENLDSGLILEYNSNFKFFMEDAEMWASIYQQKYGDNCCLVKELR
jgi:hypothetical protein